MADANKPDTVSRHVGIALMGRPRDDAFFAAMVDDAPNFAQHLISAALGYNLGAVKVTDAKGQFVVQFLGDSRGVRIDAVINEQEVQVYACEMENRPERATEKRMWYILSALSVRALKKGQDFSKLPKFCLIMIAPFSKEGTNTKKPVHRYLMMDEETHEKLGDEVEIVTIDLNYVGKDALGDMIHDFSESDPQKMRCPWVAERTHILKDTEEGREKLSTVYQEFYTEAYDEGATDTKRDAAIRMLRAKKLTHEEIAAYQDLPLAEVEKLAASVTA